MPAATPGIGSSPRRTASARCGTNPRTETSVPKRSGIPAALGAKLAHPDRIVVATVGDGSHLFANPAACHHAAEALGLPVLVVVMNNGLWNAVDKTTRLVYPDGFDARTNEMPLTS